MNPCPYCNKFVPHLDQHDCPKDRGKIAGPATVDDPAPYRPGSMGAIPIYHTEESKQRVRFSELRLTIAAQFMANQECTWYRMGTDKMSERAKGCLEAADALIARWRETT